MLFGKALNCVLRSMFDADPKFGPVNMSKIDIVDGFYQVGLRPDDTLYLGVLLPTRPGECQLIGVLLIVPIGWVEFPAAFCTATKPPLI